MGECLTRTGPELRQKGEAPLEEHRKKKITMEEKGRKKGKGREWRKKQKLPGEGTERKREQGKGRVEESSRAFRMQAITSKGSLCYLPLKATTMKDRRMSKNVSRLACVNQQT